jgi:PHP family Zn ribbon phosphoesterase
MAKRKKPNPTPPAVKVNPVDKMIQDAVQKAKARKKSGETDDTWRKEYAASLKVSSDAAPMSTTPFAGEAFKKKNS